MDQLPSHIQQRLASTGLEIVDVIDHDTQRPTPPPPSPAPPFAGMQGPQTGKRWSVRFRYDHGSEDWALVEPGHDGEFIVDGVPVNEWTLDIRAKEAANMIYDFCAPRLAQGDMVPLNAVTESFETVHADPSDVTSGLRWLEQNRYLRRLGSYGYFWTGKLRKV